MKIRIWLLVACLVPTRVALAQPAEPASDSRAGLVAQAQEQKATELRPYEPNRAERWVKQAEQLLLGGEMKWHPFFESAYRGGGFTLGAGYLTHVGDYNWLDVRASITPSAYIRAEGEFRAPHLFDRRGTLSVIGGWRQATTVGYYGLGTANTSVDDESFYSFTQPYASATLDVRPSRRWLLLTGGVEYSHWMPDSTDRRAPSIEEIHTPETAPGLGATPRYLHLSGGAALDWRTSAGYARRGGYYGVTAHDYQDSEDRYGFRRVDYEAIQHVPLGRDAWVLALRGRVETTYTNEGQVLPFFMMPSLGGGSDLRGFNSWRFRDLNSLLLQAEWRVLVNAFFETAIFYDAGKVTGRRADLNLSGLKSDYGIGMRIHGPTATPLRIDLARGNEGIHLVFSASAVF